MPKENYPSQSVEHSNSTGQVRLLLRSTNPDLPSLTNSELQTINSSSIIAGEAARTCYSKNLQTPLDYIEKSDKYRETTDRVIMSTKESGHLTTRQHVHYTFSLENFSRNAINFLHSHPYYNSEEVSQRYVDFSETKPILPHLTTEQQKVAEHANRNLIQGYQELQELLQPVVENEITKRFPKRKGEKWQDSLKSEVQKKSQEVARYVLPIGTPTNLYHTVSELTLLRLFESTRQFTDQNETKIMVDSMIEVVSQADPSIYNELFNSKITPKNHFEANFSNFKIEFDNFIQNQPAKIDSLDQGLSKVLARGVRAVLSADSNTLTDSDAIALLLDPKLNSQISKVSGMIAIDRLSQVLNQVNISAAVSLSFTANYQLQRHRSLNHTFPEVIPFPENIHDFVIPNLIKQNSELLQKYIDIHSQHIDTLQELKNLGVSNYDLQYLYPNSVRIRKTISGPLGGIFHFIKSRTCLTAQEEIYHIAISLAKQIRDASPELSPYFEKPAPCGVRQRGSITPICPEGDHFCGIRIWDLSIDNYTQRTI